MFGLPPKFIRPGSLDTRLGNRERTFRPDFTGRFAAENTTRVVFVMEFGTSNALRTLRSHVDFGSRQHADKGSSPVRARRRQKCARGSYSFRRWAPPK